MHLSAPPHRRVRRAGDERGFTVLLALFVLTITTLLLGVAYVAVLNDTALSRNDLDQKRAYAAAQAGIQVYDFQLNQDPNYWTTCKASGGTTVPASVAVPGSTGNGPTEYYSYKLLPVLGQTCSTSNPITTMIEPSTSAASGTFRLSSTGTSNNVSRTIVAQYKRASLLDYVYYTKYETSDPNTLGPPIPSDCGFYYGSRGGDCGSAIQFASTDNIKGPVHTNDKVDVQSGATFGRSSSDRIEFDRGYYGGTPVFTGTYVNPPAADIDPPLTDTQLLNVAQAGGTVYTGTTTIALAGTTMTVTNPVLGWVNHAAAWPANGVIYVKVNGTCPVTYTPTNPSYTTDTNCGNLYVSGTYSNSLTIASDNDIVITGNISPTGTALTNPVAAPNGTALLGLVANSFVRIQNGQTTCGSPSNIFDSPIWIYAAILAVAHSFIVDNYNCGPDLGTLHVYGAIAQLYRGPVGRSGGNGYTTKDYNYDSRLASTEPPYFLSPSTSTWAVLRQSECAASSASC
jgi:Tfp pilus assembly protein PilX